MMKNWFFLFLLSSTSLLRGFDHNVDPNNQVTPNHFLLFSVPKSGTHLMFKCLKMLIDFSPVDWSKEPFWDDFPEDIQFEQNLLRWQANQLFLSSHPCPLYDGNLVAEFSLADANYKKLLIIRDLRDVIISFTYGFQEECQEEAGEAFVDFDSSLRYVLESHADSCANYFLEESVKGAIELAKNEDVFVIRFEDLIGEKGGGDDESQKKVIQHLCLVLGIEQSESLIDKIKNELFGNRQGPAVSVTFRSGQVGVWKNYFNASHLEIFYEKWGRYQEELGYPLE